MQPANSFKHFSSVRGGLLFAFCLLFALLGCSDDRSAQIEKQQRQIRTLQRQNDSLQQRLKAQSDTLRRPSSQIRKLKESVKNLRKLRSLLLDNRVGVWEPGEQALHIRFGDSVDAQTVRDLVEAFNERYAGEFNPRLQLQSVEGSVARVGVSDDDRIGEQMGTTGSEMYMATMTYTLTSLCRIDSVYLDIKGGSHASPGYYSRESWVSLVQEE